MIEPMELQKSSNRKNMMVDKAINTDPINLTAQKDSVDVKRSSHVKVETSQGYEEDSTPSVNPYGFSPLGPKKYKTIPRRTLQCSFFEISLLGPKKG
jgi:hypothetical protein